MFAIIGTLVVLGSVLGGFMMGGSHLLLLWHPLEIVVILGGALGAFLISNPLTVIKSSFSGALGLVKGPRYGRAEYIQLLKLVYEHPGHGPQGRRAGHRTPHRRPVGQRYLQEIPEDHGRPSHHPEFITDCLRLISGGNLDDPHELESLLEYELEAHHKEAAEPAFVRMEAGSRSAVRLNLEFQSRSSRSYVESALTWAVVM